MTSEEKDILEQQFPRFVDKPRLIGIFEMDEFFILFGTIGTVFALSLAFPMANSMFVMLFAIFSSVIIAYSYKKFKGSASDGYTFQKLYKMGVISPDDNFKDKIKYSYLRKIGRVIPYGFTKVFYQ